MRIISPFHDYYDTAMAYGQDDSIKFIRKTQEVGNDLFPELFRERQKNILFNDKKNRLRSINLNYLLFCGEVIPFIRVSSGGPCYYEWDIKKTSIREFLFYFERAEKIIYRWMNEIPNIKEKLIEKKVTLGLVELHNRKDECKTIINPSLREIEFFKVKDAFTTFQEIQMYVSGVLSFPHNFMEEIEDKYRFENHGFDPKYGFRKRKQK